MTSILTTKGGGEGERFYTYIYIHIYISSFKLLIVCLDYQNHSSALPAAVMPKCLPCLFPLPSSQLCSPPECSGYDHGPRRTSPSITWGLSSPCPCCSTCPSATSGGKKPKDLSGGWGASASSPVFPAQRRCSHQKTLLKDDSFYFFSDISILGKTEKRKRKTKKGQNRPLK